MTLKLSNGEQASIDLILDKVQDRAAADTMSRSSSVASSNAPATNAVQQLLGLLSTMPVEEPAADLVARTMALIDRTAVTIHPSVNASVNASRVASNSVLSALAAHPQQ